MARVRNTYIGILDPWFETGLEGVVWSLYEDGKVGYEGLHPLEDGDHLEIIADDGRVVWDGVIDLDWEIGMVPVPDTSYPGLKQQAALGYWIHGVQRGFDPDGWAQLFFDRLTGVLTKEEDEEERAEEGTEE